MASRDISTIATLSQTDISVNDISDSYFIQLVEEKLRNRAENPLRLQYFFDSYDIINMIQGAMTYADVINTGFNYSRYDQDRLQNLVYAFAFQGLYDSPIKMLEPHKIEFFNKVYNHSYDLKLPENQDAYRDLLQEVLYLLDRKSDNIFNSPNISNIDDYVQNLIQKSPEVLRVNFLLKGFISWKRRLKFLQGEQIIALESVQSELVEIDDVDLFRLINSGFKNARPEGTNNNFHDSLAFYHLQKLLENYKDDPKQTLPIFFSSTPAVRNAINHIRGEDPSLFSYELNLNESEDLQRIPIVRDPLFFVLEPIFTVNDRTEVFFESLKKSRPLILTLIQEEFSQVIDQYGDLGDNFRKAKHKFENSIREIIEVKLTQEIWLKKKAYEGFVEELKKMISWSEQELEAVEKEIDSQLTSILGKAKYSLERSRQLSAIIRSFRSVEKDVELILRQNSIVAELDIFRDFALVKFGLDKRKLPRLQDLVDILIVDAVNETTPALYNILSSLSTKVDSSKKAERFLQGIVIAWLLKKHNLVIELCCQISPSDIQNRYETALIYAASIIARRRNKNGIEETLKIIHCILKKKNQNYKVWIGIAYLYYRVWEVKNNQNRQIPEMNAKKWEQIQKEAFYEEYLQKGAFFYTKKAYNFLRAKQNNEDDEYGDNPYLGYFLYALNNFVFYTTKSGTKEQFESLQPFVNELKDYESYLAEWQGRFYDTLGWYNLRMSFYNEKFKTIYIDQAGKYLISAKRHIASPRDQIMYRQLEDALIEIQMR